MSTGSCACGAIGIKTTGDVQVKALCHCADCKKITGSTYSTNIVVPGVEVTKGSTKKWTKTADSGNPITSHICAECGTTLYREGPTFGDAKVIKVGVLDGNALEQATPGVELYTKDRVSWVSAVSGAGQKVGMPDSADA
ncbi:hypothetical protein CBER1_02574 [Cercospora berteroae]|uniref:CENP-V/GFA domain-containing protein n=2 Tax=Cercospora TaxID=29002 RepID=A0A2S6CEN8_9PEZI|nr:uncharacterized protein CKM354_000547200 [Cercospora kikuchii]PPJ58202.1 hypothetical protein CBER1_02574 [Cercospora berteroae]GIZ42194.1 hypothetical protein CKM354_000547200 [Cercospora kikuchii]